MFRTTSVSAAIMLKRPVFREFLNNLAFSFSGLLSLLKILSIASLLIFTSSFSEVSANEPKRALPTTLRTTLTAEEISDRDRIYESLDLKAYGARVAPSKSVNIRGWNHLFRLLAARGIPPKELQKVFSDKRMPRYQTLSFSIEPREPSNIYRRRNNKKEVKNALQFYKKHSHFFKQAEAKFGVDSSILLALLQIETRCGKFTGKSKVFHRLARLAAAAEPANIDRNFERHKAEIENLTISPVAGRALWLEETFLPHVAATIEIARLQSIHPLEVKGSVAGAIGLPQFLPGNQLIYGVDGDKDGVVDLFKPQDAIYSMANFLKSKGWRPGLSRKQKEKVIWAYNRSDPYVELAFSLSSRLAPHMN